MTPIRYANHFVTVGYHRYFTHKSFKTSRPVQFVLGVLGSMAEQDAKRSLCVKR